MQKQRNLKSQTNFKEEEQNWRNRIIWFEDLLDFL